MSMNNNKNNSKKTLKKAKPSNVGTNIAIVFISILVVGAAVGIPVYFLVIKKNKDSSAPTPTPPSPQNKGLREMVNNKHNESNNLTDVPGASLKDNKMSCRNQILSLDDSWKSICNQPEGECGQYNDSNQCAFATDVDNPNTHDCIDDNEKVIKVTSKCRIFMDQLNEFA